MGFEGSSGLWNVADGNNSGFQNKNNSMKDEYSSEEDGDSAVVISKNMYVMEVAEQNGDGNSQGEE